MDFYRMVGIGYATFRRGEEGFREPDEVRGELLYQDEFGLVKEGEGALHVWYVEGVEDGWFEMVEETISN